MLNAKIKNHLHLHFLVLIAGFTAILGELISIDAIPLVWFRMLFTVVLMFLYIKITKINIKISSKSLAKLAIAGIVIALHWMAFFGSIKVSNISIALGMFSTGAFFASIIEPIVYKRKIIWYEIIIGLFVVFGVFIITQNEFEYIYGIFLGLISAFLSSLFAVLNGKFLEKHSATVISFYEFLSGVLFISIFIFFLEKPFSIEFFNLDFLDYGYLFVLASVCSAYAFIASVHVMKVISPYTVVLSYNLEPIYGILIAMYLFPEQEKMSTSFYYGAAIIIIMVILNVILKNLRFLKRKRS
ncbi:permease [Pseudalgibacter alginicilyticus]|uniref:Permease n=1 Tax=Pseudalgibacter alginicilyticus TaxID=1736674 RepID=A0A0P0CEF1_9FLAO|nr:DMT family transporter [Pseudalgibacter alginicilyticus]ALJ04359.1 permease [Pseudalgibacter alginicilyticus]